MRSAPYRALAAPFCENRSEVGRGDHALRSPVGERVGVSRWAAVAVGTWGVAAERSRSGNGGGVVDPQGTILLMVKPTLFFSERRKYIS